MTQLTRYCAGCSEDRPFEQLHAEPASQPIGAAGAARAALSGALKIHFQRFSVSRF